MSRIVAENNVWIAPMYLIHCTMFMIALMTVRNTFVSVASSIVDKATELGC